MLIFRLLCFLGAWKTIIFQLSCLYCNWATVHISAVRLLIMYMVHGANFTVHVVPKIVPRCRAGTRKPLMKPKGAMALIGIFIYRPQGHDMVTPLGQSIYYTDTWSLWEAGCQTVLLRIRAPQFKELERCAVACHCAKKCGFATFLFWLKEHARVL